MVLPLSAGWLDTGVSASHTFACSLRLRAQTAPFNSTPGGAGPASDAVIGYLTHGAPFDFYTRPSAGATFTGAITPSAGIIMLGWSSVDLVLLDQSDPYNPANHHIIASGATGSLSGPNWLSAGASTLTVANLRLGVTIETSATSSVLRYAWFSDAATTETLVLSGFTARSVTYTDPPALYGSQGLGPFLPFYRDVYPSETGSSQYDHVEFSGFLVNGSTVSPPTDPQLFKASGHAHSAFYVGNEFGLPFSWRTDVDAIDSDGTAEAADYTYSGTHTCPSTVDRTVTQYFTEDFAPPAGHHPYAQQLAGAAVLADPWLSAQTITPYSAEQFFTVEGNDPKDPAAAAYKTYNVGTVTIASPLSVLLSSNAWSTDLGTVAIGGTPTVPTFNVTVAPAIVKRTLAESWRDWNDPLSPDYQSADQYTSTKHDYYASGASDDCWGFGLYSYADVDLTPGVAGDLAFEITWAVVRENGSIVTFVRTYTATWGAGRSTQRLDLLFPNEIDRPFYGERVDQIRIIGLQVGTYTLHSLSLVTAEDAYLKAGGVRTVNADATVNTGGITISQDGQMAICQWGKDPTILPAADRDGDGFTDHLKDQQNGTMGIVLVAQGPVLTDVLGGAVGAAQSTITAVFTELSRMEGVTATYSATDLDAALIDSFGNQIGIDPATLVATPVNRSSLWITPNLPHVRITAGTPITLTARLVVDEVSVASGRTAAQMRVYQRQHLGMVIEAQATTPGGDRAAPGATVNLKLSVTGAPSGSDPTVATTTTDASGFATLPARNGRFGGQEYWFYLSGT